MSNQIVISSGAKLRNLNGVITGTTGVLDSVPLGGANGVATLDSSGKVPVSQLPSSVVTYLGTWNAATNTPTLANGTGDAGDMYLCNVAGTVNFGAGPITFAVGDWVLYGSGTWQKSNGQNGTVTSVAVTESGDALTITGSPITTAGTINIGFAGTSAQYVAGNGSLITFPSLTGYVPYTGATADVDLDTFKLNASSLGIKGTAGAGHLGLKHQSASATASASESSLFADVNGDLAWKNDNLYLSTFATYANTADRVYTFPNSSGTVALTSDLSGYLPLTGGTLSGLLNISTASYLTSRLKLTNTATGGNIWSVSSGNANNSTNNGLFSIINETLGKNIFALSPTGNIIIGEDVGTANPAYNLQVIGTNTVIRATDLTGNNSNVTLQASNSAAYLSAGYTTTAIPLIFQTGNTERLRVASTGTISTTGSITAASAIARGVYFNNTLVAAANNDVLVGLDINPTFTNGAFTGVTNTVLRLTNTAGSIGLSPVSYSNSGSSSELSLTFGNTTLSASSVLITNRLRTSTAYNNRMILTTPNIAASNAAYLFGLDSVQYNVGMLYDRDNGWLSLLNGSGTNTTTYTSRLYVHSTGNVGINTGGTDAGYKLDVNGTGRFTGALNGTSATFSSSVSVNTTNAVSTLEIGAAESDGTGSTNAFRIQSKTGASNQQLLIGINQTGTYSFLQSSQASVGYKPLALNPNGGNVGIGTSSPNAKLQVSSASNFSAILKVSDTGTESTGIIALGDGNSTLMNVGIWRGAANSIASIGNCLNLGSYSDMVFAVSAAGLGSQTERMRITSGGNVLIGNSAISTSNTAIFLQKSGLITNVYAYSSGTINLIEFYSQATGSMFGSISYNGILTLYNATSDYRLKEDLKDYSGLEIVSKLKTYDFNWKKANVRDYGMMAHELQEVLPSYVTGEKDGKEMQQVDYSKLVPILIKSIQELEARLKTIENKIK